MATNKPVVLLLTATISPPANCPDLQRKDPQVRLADYKEALLFYLSRSNKLIDRIIFVENSDSDLTPLSDAANAFQHGKRIEFLSFEGGNKFPPEYGKGYGEMLLLNYALETSQMLSTFDTIWKATGRLILSNIEDLIKHAPSNYEVYCDLHKSYKLLSLDYFFDPRFYSFTLDGYNKYFKDHVVKLPCKHIEHYFYEVLMPDVISNQRIYPRFFQQPMIKGFTGSLNSDYFTLRKKVQRFIQDVFRRTFPWIWI
jgi:hypothetical protein